MPDDRQRWPHQAAGVACLVLALFVQGRCAAEDVDLRAVLPATEFDGPQAAEFFVSPSGTPNGTGTKASPWDLKTALLQDRAVRPGDTVWLRGGEYRGSYLSRLSGTAGRPVFVRQFPGERATIDFPVIAGKSPLLEIVGDHCVFWGFEVTCSHPQRYTSERGSSPSNLSRGQISITGANVSLINLVIHDLGSGVGHWAKGAGGLIYGCLIYNCGWNAPDRAHGHGIYSQSKWGRRTIADNVIFHQFGHGISCYGSERAALDHVDVVGNVAFNNGILKSNDHRTCGLALGGSCGFRDIRVTDNLFFSDLHAAVLQLGWPEGPLSRQALVLRNLIYGQVRLTRVHDIVVERNRFWTDHDFLSMTDSEDVKFRSNDYGNSSDRPAFYVKDAERAERLKFADWQRLGHDERATFQIQSEPESVVFIRPNLMVPGRAHVAVYGTQCGKITNLDLSGVLRVGQAYRIVSVHDFYGASLGSGIYDGEEVTVHTDRLPVATPVGMHHRDISHPDHLIALVVLPE